MEATKPVLSDFYGNRTRLRVCGILFENDKILLVNLALYGSGKDFWSPPGGGVEFGETLSEALKREFKEETGLDVEVGDLLFVNEFINPPLHAVEMFFIVTSRGKDLIIGVDPEFSLEEQIIKDVRFISIDELKNVPADFLHGLLKNINSIRDIFDIKGCVSLK